MTQTATHSDLHAALRARITHWTLQLITTPPGAARRPIYAVIRDLEKLLKFLPDKTT